MAAISEELIEKMVRGRGAGRRSPEESLKLLIQLRRAFPQLGMAEVPRFLKVAENICYAEGSFLTTQGERNEYLWLLLSGTLNVIVNSQMVAQLSEGALVGEAGPTENLGTWMQLLGFWGAFFQYFRGGRGKMEDN